MTDWMDWAGCLMAVCVVLLASGWILACFEIRRGGSREMKLSRKCIDWARDEGIRQATGRKPTEL